MHNAEDTIDQDTVAVRTIRQVL